MKKLKNIIFLVIMCIFLFVLTGCNFKKITNLNTIDYSDKIKIGDYVAYDEGNNNTYKIDGNKLTDGKEMIYSTNGKLKWRVFGFDDKGRIQLICDDTIYKDKYNEDHGGELKNIEDYSKTLDAICSIYGKGNGAESARSITLNDIKKYLDCDEETLKSGKCEVYNYANDSSNEYNILFRNEENLYKKYHINSIIDYNKKTYTCEFNDQKIDLLIGIYVSNVMPIVTLKSNVQITEKDENGAWQIEGTNKEYDNEEYIKISNVNDYIKLTKGEYSWDKNYILTNDIDLSNVKNLNSIGNKKNGNKQYFTGKFDGNNHSIIGAKIQVTKNGNAGLFYATYGATIKNLNVKKLEIKIVEDDDKSIETYQVGGLVGDASNTKIINCNIDGKISENVIEQRLDDSAGIVIGMLAGEIHDGSLIYKCSTSGNIQTHSNRYVGGFTGSNNGKLIERCSSNVNIEIDRGTGCGFVARTYGAIILKSYNRGNVKGNLKCYTIAGFAGDLSGGTYLTQCYAMCDISGSNNLFGFCNSETTSGGGIITDSYFIGKLNGAKYDNYSAFNYSRGFVGSDSPTVVTSYVDASGSFSDSVSGTLYYNKDNMEVSGKKTIGLTTEEFQKKESFKLFNFNYVWKWDDNQKRPRLMYEFE